MSNTYRQSQRRGRERDRLAWLTERLMLLNRLPSMNADVSDDERDALREAYDGLLVGGLYAITSDRTACYWGIRRLVAQLRGEKEDKAQRYAGCLP